VAIVAGNSLIATAGLPERRRLDVGRIHGSQVQGQQQPQPKDRLLAICVLTAAFRSKGRETGGLMHQFNCGFNLIAMLSAGSAVACAALQAAFEQLFGWQS
jgi:hypothetical protein